MTDTAGLVELRELLAKATARPWVAFDEGTTFAVMRGKCPPLKDNGYPVRRWPEIVSWPGFDSSDYPFARQRANLHLIVAAVNALPSLLDTLEQQAEEIARLREVLAVTRELVARCAASGFTDQEAVTCLYKNNGSINAALTKGQPNG